MEVSVSQKDTFDKFSVTKIILYFFVISLIFKKSIFYHYIRLIIEIAGIHKVLSLNLYASYSEYDTISMCQKRKISFYAHWKRQRIMICWNIVLAYTWLHLYYYHTIRYVSSALIRPFQHSIVQMIHSIYDSSSDGESLQQRTDRSVAILVA